MTIDEMTIDEVIELLKDKRMEINYKVNGTTQFSEALDMAIKALEQEPRKGHWEHGRELSRVFMGATLKGIIYEDWHCSNCHCVIEHSIKPKWNYCPNCGAEMEGEDETDN